MAGVCCSAATPGCCPLGASCVRCASRFRCTNSRVSTLAHRCSICSADSPPECSRHGRGDGSSAAANAFASVFAGVVVLGLLCCCCVAMILRIKEGSQPHAVVGYPVGPPGYVQPGAAGGGVYPGGVYPCGGVSSTTVATVGADWVWPLDLSGACWSGTSSPITAVAMNMMLTTTVALTALMRAATPALMRICDCVQLQGVRRVSSYFTHVAS